MNSFLFFLDRGLAPFLSPIEKLHTGLKNLLCRSSATEEQSTLTYLIVNAIRFLMLNLNSLLDYIFESSEHDFNSTRFVGLKIGTIGK